MEIEFFKYHGTGNDFILIDNRKFNFIANQKQIESLCHRRFGIGADGLILIQNHQSLDFEMRYFNSDGREASMCGNGGRCAVAFAAKLGLIKSQTTFQAFDGVHKAIINGNLVELSMSDVTGINKIGDQFLLDTGSPHIVTFVEDLDKIDVFKEGFRIRHDKNISEHGVNVNFVKIQSSKCIEVRTYERGVEDETWSCGTGSIASAIVSYLVQNIGSQDYSYEVNVKGGVLKISFETANKTTFTNIRLTGPATMVFSGTTTIQ